MINEQPDESGHFGEFGGRFVSETLIHALDELREAYGRWRQDDEFIARMDLDLAHYVGRPSPVYFAQRYSEAAGGGKNLPEKGRPEPHGCAQNQQHHGPGFVGTLHGQKAGHSRNRRRTAWCGLGDRGCQVKSDLPGLYGCR